MSDSPSTPPTPLYKSSLADHPDIREILPIFTGRLPTHVKKLRHLHTTGNLEELRRFAHQLRGTGKSYGFDSLSTHAATLEDLLLAQRPHDEITRALNQLIVYMENIEGYAPA